MGAAEWNPFELSTEANQEKDKITERSKKYQMKKKLEEENIPAFSPGHLSSIWMNLFKLVGTTHGI